MPILKSNGYVYVYLPAHPLAHKDGYVAEHRLVVWEAGLTIGPSDQVHHINGIKTDNRLENLEVHGESEHHRLHVGSTVVNQYGEWTAREDWPHGDYRRYLGRKGDDPRGCRCRPCKTAWAIYYRERRYRKK